MTETSTNWLKKHGNKLAYIVLLVIILIFGISYINLKKESKIAVNAAVEQYRAQELAKVEQAKIEAEAIDTVPPRIDSSCFISDDTLKKNEERVCIEIGNWSGYLDSTNSMPITGKIVGDVKSVTVDGKKITWDENKQIYQRINLYVYGGLNKYKVVAEDMKGNKSTGYIETDAANTSNDVNVNLNQ